MIDAATGILEDGLEQMNRVLVVDDEASIRLQVADYLKSRGFRVRTAPDAETARVDLEKHACDLVVLDLMMPGESGLSLCVFVQGTYHIPVLMLTALKEEIDCVVGLEIGADDYLTKPFSPRELVARITSILRRTQAIPHGDATPTSALAFGNWVLNLDERTLVDADDISVSLSTGEFALLRVMLERPRVVLSREQLLSLTRGREADVFDRSIDNMVSRLRRKIEPDPRDPQTIKTVWGGGYVLNAEVNRL